MDFNSKHLTINANAAHQILYWQLLINVLHVQLYNKEELEKLIAREMHASAQMERYGLYPKDVAVWPLK